MFRFLREKRHGVIWSWWRVTWARHLRLSPGIRLARHAYNKAPISNQILRSYSLVFTLGSRFALLRHSAYASHGTRYTSSLAIPTRAWRLPHHDAPHTCGYPIRNTPLMVSPGFVCLYLCSILSSATDGIIYWLAGLRVFRSNFLQSPRVSS